MSSKVDVSEMMGSEVYLHVNAVGRDVVLRIPHHRPAAEHRAGIPYRIVNGLLAFTKHRKYLSQMKKLPNVRKPSRHGKKSKNGCGPQKLKAALSYARLVF